MEEILLRVGSQAANFAIRSGLGYASKFAFVQVSKYIQGAPDEVTPELEKLRRRLENKIKIVTPAIDLIERIAARGNTSLASTVQLTTALRHDINEFGQKVTEATESQSSKSKSKTTSARDTDRVLESMRDLLRRIEDAVPLISLALTTSGANLSSSLPDTVSPSRLLQASSLLRSADELFEQNRKPVQVGPTFIVKFYSIFTSHARVSSVKDIQWKEEYAKCRVSIVRVPSRAHKDDGMNRNSADEARFSDVPEGYEYELRLVEDLDDGRYHDEVQNMSRKQMKSIISEKGYIEGRVRHIPVHKIARLFYEHAGILLNLGESLSPVLIAKIQHAAPHPQTVLERFTNPGDESEEEFLTGLESDYETEEEEVTEKGAWMGDIEWIAFEVFQDDDSDFEDEDSEDSEDNEVGEDLVPAMSSLKLDESPVIPPSSQPGGLLGLNQHSSLSLLEYILRLAALQTFEQQSHMYLSDEHIVLFLRDDNPTTRQQPTLVEQSDRPNLHRRESILSISSDFSSRAIPNTTHAGLPLSPPHSEENEIMSSLGARAITPTASSSPIPSEKVAEKPGARNQRSHLERAMAADYDPMTLMTPLSNRRVTRGKVRQKQLIIQKRNTENLKIRSVPNSEEKGANGKVGNKSPLAGKGGVIPVRRSVSASTARRHK